MKLTGSIPAWLLVCPFWSCSIYYRKGSVLYRFFSDGFGFHIIMCTFLQLVSHLIFLPFHPVCTWYLVPFCWLQLTIPQIKLNISCLYRFPQKQHDYFVCLMIAKTEITSIRLSFICVWVINLYIFLNNTIYTCTTYT